MIRIPRTATSRGERTYALLILRVPRRSRVHRFEGRLFRTGSRVEIAQLRPTPEYPETPLLLEYAGNDRSGWGHRRSKDIHILWKFAADRGEWEEIARVLSQGSEWFQHLAPIARREIGSRPVRFVDVASTVSGRVLALLDREMDALEDECRLRVMSFLYDQFTARLVEDEEAAESAARFGHIPNIDNLPPV